MGSCTRRHFLLSICILQLLLVIERQVFDFLGYMWIPILMNFLHIIFVIFGFFGSYQFRPKYLIAYSLWILLWIGWNTFLICFYLSVGILDKNSSILNLGTGAVSWFEVNGYGCNPVYNSSNIDPLLLIIKPDRVDDCLLDYEIIEIIQAGLQCFLAVLGLIGAICIGRVFFDDDDSLSRCSAKSKQRQSLYSIEFSPPVDAIRGHNDDLLDSDGRGPSLSPKPMTPRRVKRRSVMTRGTNSRQSSSSRRSHSNNRNSVRNSRRKVHQNPVTKLMEQQQNQQHMSGTTHQIKLKPPYPSFTHKKNPELTANNLKSLNSDYVSTGPKHLNNFNQPNMNSFSSQPQHNITPDPIYYNMNSSSPLLQQQTSWNSINMSSQPQGHANPTYQHSTPNLNHSPDLNDEYYTNRPPSVRSSYSNFHGARPLSQYNNHGPPSGGQENVFAGINNNLNNMNNNMNNHHHHHHHHMPSTSSSPQQGYAQAIPQLPQKRSVSRESLRSMAFLNNGPPAYNLNYHTPPDSETTM